MFSHHFSLTVVKVPAKSRVDLELRTLNQYTGHPNLRVVHLSYARRSDEHDEDEIRIAAEEVMKELTEDEVFGRSNTDPHRIKLAEIKRRILSLLRKRQKMIRLKASAKASDPSAKYNFERDESPKFGIFWKAHEDSAKTKCILGSSFSGKTHFLVDELNKLPVTKTRVYDKIILFTESPNSEPVKRLKPALEVLVVPMYVPKIVQLLRSVNQKSKNHFRFLIILDDVVSGIRAGTFLKQILTMRNAQISTCILLQYAKLVTPSARNSFHDYYIVQLRQDDWEYILKQFIGPLVKAVMGHHKYEELAEMLKTYMQKQGRILHYNQVRDTLFIRG